MKKMLDDDRAEALSHRYRWHRTLVLSVWYSFVAAMAAQPSLDSVAKGHMSDQQIAKQVIVRTPAEWKALWNDHAPMEKMPVVDFSKNMIVGIFLGTKPSGGHDVEIVGVRMQDKDLIVEYVQKQPGRGTMAAQMLTAPYHLVSVAKHPGTVRFIHVPETGR